MRTYVVGFVLDNQENTALLIKKTKPDWQKGRWNGIGGKIEVGEKPHEAMVREFWEETGVETDEGEWLRVFELNDPGCVLYTYFFIGTEERIREVMTTAKTTTEEQVKVVPMVDLNRWNAIHNLPWKLEFMRCYFNMYEQRTEYPILPVKVDYYIP